MDKLISSEKLIHDLSGIRDTLPDIFLKNVMSAAISCVEKQPPTVDAVEVVRCKDCIHWDSETGWCNNNSAFDDYDMGWEIYNDDDFCSCGERRTDG